MNAGAPNETKFDAKPQAADAPAFGGGWRLLHVEPDGIEALKVKLALRRELPSSAVIDHASDWSEAEARLRDAKYDAVLVGCALEDEEGDAALKRLVAAAGEAPVAILSGDNRLSAALAAGRSGAGEFLLKSKLSGEALSSLLRRMIHKPEPIDELAPIERRRKTRYEIAAAAVIVPINADGRPGREIPGNLVDMSEIGLGLLARVDADAVPDLCLVGLEGSDGAYRFATVEWRQRRLALPAIHFGGRFVLSCEDPFSAAKLRPQFDPETYRFRPQFDPHLLDEWIARGILRPRVVDRVKSCPECRSLPTFRDGCPQCGSADVAPRKIIHHFACAHVGPVEQFTTGGASGSEGNLTCPKCLSAGLVVGADFEFLPGPVACHECSWSDAAPGLIGECLGCGRRFPGTDAVEVDVLAYHVQRLDPVAFLANAR